MTSIIPSSIDSCETLIIVFPFPEKRLFNLLLILHVDNVDDHQLSLQESVTPVNRLNEIVEFIINSDKYLPMTISLKIASGS